MRILGRSEVCRWCDERQETTTRVAGAQLLSDLEINSSCAPGTRVERIAKSSDFAFPRTLLASTLAILRTRGFAASRWTPFFAETWVTNGSTRMDCSSDAGTAGGYADCCDAGKARGDSMRSALRRVQRDGCGRVAACAWPHTAATSLGHDTCIAHRRVQRPFGQPLLGRDASVIRRRSPGIVFLRRWFETSRRHGPRWSAWVASRRLDGDA